MYRIAPDFETSIPFDLIVYEDAVQFHLEKCQPICLGGNNSNPCLQKSFNELRVDLIKCLRVLHSLHIVHKDLKPTNILYS